MTHIDADYAERLRLRALGFRFVHARSARKHRRQGHEVRWVPACFQYAWRPKLTPEQEDAILLAQRRELSAYIHGSRW